MGVFFMAEFLAENYGSITAGAVVLIIVALIIAGMVKSKRAGKHSCAGDCAHCGGCAHNITGKKAK